MEQLPLEGRAVEAEARLQEGVKRVLLGTQGRRGAAQQLGNLGRNRCSVIYTFLDLYKKDEFNPSQHLPLRTFSAVAVGLHHLT